jgi:hypothetical protein
MEKLPNELLEVIFDYTDGKTKVRIFCICKRFCEIIMNSLTLMKDIGRNLTVNFENVDWKDGVMSEGENLLSLSALAESQRRFQHLKLVNIQKLPEQNMETDIAYIVQNLGRHLTDLTIEATQINFKALERVADNFQQLKTIKITLTCKEHYTVPETFETNFDVEEFHRFLNTLKSIKNLDLEFYCHYNISRDIFPQDFCNLVQYQLESFKVSRIQLNKNFLKFLTMQKNLKRLEIYTSFFTPDTTLNDLFGVLLKMNELKSVNIQIYGVTVVKDDTPIQQVDSKIQSLSCMILTHTDESHKEFYLEKFIENLSNLESLRFSTEYTEARNLAWINNLSKLRQLELIDCKPDVVQNINLPNLEILKIKMGPIQSLTKDLTDLWNSFFERHPRIKILHLTGLPIEKDFLLNFCKILSEIEYINAKIFEADTAKLMLEFFPKLKYAKLFVDDSIFDETEKLFLRSNFYVNRKFYFLECTKC